MTRGRLTALLAALALTPAAPAAAAGPSTGFEARGGDGWTTLAEEEGFLRALEGPRVRSRVVGTSAQGRAIRLVVVGPPATPAAIRAQSTALLVCAQHGDEPAGREACLARIREQARRPAAPGTLLVMPTANPDGRAADTREHGGSPPRDVNRDFGCAPGVACTPFLTPEARAVREVIARYDPELVLDHHEDPAPGASAVLLNRRGASRHGMPAVRALGDAANLAAELRLRAATTQTGTFFGVGIYEQAPSTVDRALRDFAPRAGAAFVLVESPSLGRLSPRSRVQAHALAMDGALSVPRVLPAP